MFDSHRRMLKIYLLLNLTTQLDNTSLDQPISKQCFMLFSLCVKRALAIKEKTLWSKTGGAGGKADPGGAKEMEGRGATGRQKS